MLGFSGRNALLSREHVQSCMTSDNYIASIIASCIIWDAELCPDPLSCFLLIFGTTGKKWRLIHVIIVQTASKSLLITEQFLWSLLITEHHHCVARNRRVSGFFCLPQRRQFNSDLTCSSCRSSSFNRPLDNVTDQRRPQKTWTLARAPANKRQHANQFDR